MNKYGQVPKSKVRKSQSEILEKQRVAAILARDAEDRADEERRDIAIADLEDDRFVNLDDIPVPPTPEQLAKGQFVPFTADKVDGTVRPMRTVRRVMPIRIDQLNERGVLDDDMYAAAKWYRDHWERSGLDVTIQAAQYDERIVGEKLYGAMARSEAQVISRDFYRGANAAISLDFRATFDAVVLLDVDLKTAAKTQRCRYQNLVPALRHAALELHGFAAPFLPVRQA